MHVLRLLLLCLALAATAVPLGATSAHDRLFVGAEALLRGRYELAAQTFAEALAADPENPYARTRLALALAGTGQADRARVELEKALAARTDDLFALWSLGCLDLQSGRPAAAAARFAAMDKADPGNLRSMLGLGLAALQERRTAEGVKLVGRVQQAESGDALIRFLTGYAYWLENAPANARLELEATLELEPRNIAALELLGLVYRRQGKAGLAASAWGQALAIDPNAAGARFFLSRLAEDEGLAATLADRPAEAKRAYERALAADPGNAAAAKALGLGVPQPTAPPAQPPSASPLPGREQRSRPTQTGDTPGPVKKKTSKASAAPIEIVAPTPDAPSPDAATPAGQPPQPGEPVAGPSAKPFIPSPVPVPVRDKPAPPALQPPAQPVAPASATPAGASPPATGGPETAKPTTSSPTPAAPDSPAPRSPVPAADKQPSASPPAAEQTPR